MPLAWVASVHPVTLRPVVAVGLLTVDTVIIVLTDACPSVKLVTHITQLAVGLLLFCGCHYTGALLRCITGSSGAEESSPGRLTSSLEHSMPDAPMPLFEPAELP